MNKYLILAALIATFTIIIVQNSLAQVTITTPLYEVTDIKGVPVDGLSKSTTIPKAMEKASSLPDGSYLIKHNDITVTVTGNAPVVVEPPVVEPVPEPTPTPVSGDIPYGDIPALQDMGLLPEYGIATHTVNPDLDIAWHGGAGERDEIGLFPEQHAAFIAGQADLKDSILQAALAPPPDSMDYAHHPNEFWLPFLLTGDVRYIANMEKVYKQYKNYRNQTPDSYIYYQEGREGAWNLRDLAQLAYLQGKGLTTETYYIDALKATRDRWFGFINNPDRPVRNEFNLLDFRIGSAIAYGWTGWMESMLGQAVNYTAMLTKDEVWKDIAAFHFKHLLKSSGDKWPLKAVGYDHVLFSNYMLETDRTNWSKVDTFSKTADWTVIQPYHPEVMTGDYADLPDDDIPDLSARAWSYPLTYTNRAQEAYAWASLACNNQIDRACDKAQQLKDAIAERGDSWGYKYGVEMAFPVSDNYSTGSGEDIHAGVTPPTNAPAWVSSLVVGEWTSLANTDYDNNGKGLISPQSGYLGTDPLRALITAYSDGTYDKYNKQWHFYGGGHGDGTMNAVMTFDLSTLAWSVTIPPTDPAKYPPVYNLGANPDYPSGFEGHGHFRGDLTDPADVVYNTPHARASSHMYAASAAKKQANGDVTIDYFYATPARANITQGTWEIFDTIDYGQQINDESTNYGTPYLQQGTVSLYDEVTDKFYVTMNPGDFGGGWRSHLLQIDADTNQIERFDSVITSDGNPLANSVTMTKVGRSIYLFNKKGSYLQPQDFNKGVKYNMDTKAIEYTTLTGDQLIFSEGSTQETCPAFYNPTTNKIYRWNYDTEAGFFYVVDLNTVVGGDGTRENPLQYAQTREAIGGTPPINTQYRYRFAFVEEWGVALIYPHTSQNWYAIKF